MKIKLVVLALILSLMPGCTIALGVLGSTRDSPKPNHAVAQADGGTPGYRRVPPPSAKDDDDDGSGTMTGILLGAVIDAALITVLVSTAGDLSFD